jgi:hypothetical protein
VGQEPVEVELSLKRWVNMAERNWFSGDTHVHRTLQELPLLMLAEDLNVALPQTYWVTQAGDPPSAGDRNMSDNIPAGLIEVDDTHVIWPRNTEYEITHVGDQFHNMGAVFIHNHQEPFTLGAPPMAPVAEEARRQGALIDLDKHDWPWSFMLVPIMQVDLFELANNHMWRTEFGFTKWNQPAAPFMYPSDNLNGGDELDWIEYGFESYYLLLNCDFRLRPTAGCASGVHPVPLGFSRVYVHCPGGFSYDKWMKALDAGRSFVTTGPMLLAEVNGEVPGATIEIKPPKAKTIRVTGRVLSEQPVREVEIVSNGEVVRTAAMKPVRTRAGAWEARFNERIKLSGTRWVALRCWEERADGRFRFAHTAPTWFDDPQQPILPDRASIEFLIGRMQEQIQANEGVLSPEALQEYHAAKALYEDIADRVR